MSDNLCLRIQLICSLMATELSLADSHMMRLTELRAKLSRIRVEEFNFCLTAMTEANIIDHDSTNVWLTA